jgi:hypothetical protein
MGHEDLVIQACFMHCDQPSNSYPKKGVMKAGSSLATLPFFQRMTKVWKERPGPDSKNI